MKVEYHCEKWNICNNASFFLIADESRLISSPAYIHTFFVRTLNQRYGIISSGLGIPMPYSCSKNMLIIGTEYNIYFINMVKNEIETIIPIDSASLAIIEMNEMIVSICETDILIVSKEGNKYIKYDDVISHYEISDRCICVWLMDGKMECINI